MFYNANGFNSAIGAWDVSKVKTMVCMFSYADVFNSAIEAWDVSKVKAMGLMFYNANGFNSAIGAWNTSNVKDMSQMFLGANVFNDPTIVAWDVSSVTNFAYMFFIAVAFNVDVSPWAINEANLQYCSFAYMFYDASAFNQVLCWNPTNYKTFMFKNSDGSADSSADKCACAADEFYDGSNCTACASGTISFGKTESCMSYAPTPAPTVSFLPTNTMTPTIEKTPIHDGNFHAAMNAWFSDEEGAEGIYGHISGKK
jgi:hypothetical protein